MDNFKEILLEPIIEGIKWLANTGFRYWHYHKDLEQNVNKLKRKVDVLNDRKEDTESRIEEEKHRRSKRVKKEVERWIKDVEMMNDKKREIEEKVSTVSFISRAGLGKVVCQKIEEVERIYRQGSFPEGVSVERPPTVGLTLPTTNLEGEIDVKEEIWKYLRGDDQVGMIGVCGMGGIGKTTIMKHINNQLVKENQFDQVIWATVSKEVNIFKLQEHMARSMKMELDFQTNELERAVILKEALEQKRYVLILDDVWERFDLCEVGIIETTLGKDRKVVLTSRSIDVCKSMGCKVVKVQPLSKQESMNLFLHHAGHNVQQNRGLGDIVDKIVEQCGGLPLAIATIGSSMKGEVSINQWRNTLKELQDRVKSVKGSDKLIFEQLKFSYDRLKDYPSIQNCFLYCSLYAEDDEIGKVELIESWINEGLLDGLETRQAMFDRGYSILNKLENNCLLERVGVENIFERVKMHDVLRDMALAIKSNERFMVKAGAQLKEVPGEHEWKTSLEKISLMKNSRIEIIPHLSPKCTHLTTLLLQGCDQLKCLSESFFTHMPSLKVINLSSTAITHLPNSISFLKNLIALILVGCERLKFLPSLSELRALRKLDLIYSDIEEVPQGLEMLENLTYLRLGSRYLKELPVGTISPSNFHLQYLAATGMYLRGEEVAILRKLEILVCSFSNLKEFEKYTRLIQGEFPTYFYVMVGSILRDINILGDEMLNFKEAERRIMFCGCEMEKMDDMIVPNDLHTLGIDECDGLEHSLSKNPVFHKTTGLNVCNVVSCEEIECVVDLSSSSSSATTSCYALQGIEVLALWSLRNLGELVRLTVESYPALTSPVTAITIFSSLRELDVNRCPKIETLFPVELLQGLHNLEKIQVRYCEKIEKIFGDQGNEKTTSILPKLKSFSLHELPKLKRICSVGVMIHANHLQFLHIVDCQQLKRIPVCLTLSKNGQPSPPPCLKEIQAWPREWWETVELDHPSPSAKDVLSSFATYKDDLYD